MNTSEYYPFLDILEVTIASKLFIALIALIYMPYFSFEKKNPFSRCLEFHVSNEFIKFKIKDFIIDITVHCMLQLQLVLYYPW